MKTRRGDGEDVLDLKKNWKIIEFHKFLIWYQFTKKGGKKNKDIQLMNKN